MVELQSLGHRADWYGRDRVAVDSLVSRARLPGNPCLKRETWGTRIRVDREQRWGMKRDNSDVGHPPQQNPLMCYGGGSRGNGLCMWSGYCPGTQNNTGGGSAPSKPAPNKPGCQAGPLNLSQNIQAAKSLAGQFWSGVLNAGSIGGAASAGAAAGTYVSLVQTGGAWDPKNGPGGPTAVNIAAGNINFGATCSQFGFNTSLGGQVCQFGAGIYGKLSGVYGSPLFSQYHGDIPSDNQQIRQGLAIAKKGGC